MANMTQKDILESVLSELVHIKTHMPNGELKVMIEDMKEVKEDLSELKIVLLDPEDGVIVKTNKNTWWREQHEKKQELYDKKVVEFDNLKQWKENVTRALWIMFGTLVALAAKVLFFPEM